MTKKILGLIPVRLGSTRLPAKALLPINNLPLIIHVYIGNLHIASDYYPNEMVLSYNLN